VIGRRRVEAEAHEAADGERIRGAPRDATFGVETFEIADQQQGEVPAGRQAWSSHHRRVESLTLLLGKPVEAGVVENAVQPRVERMAGETGRSVVGTRSGACSLVRLPIAMGRTLR
jgi:hypothetical protein